MLQLLEMSASRMSRVIWDDPLDIWRATISRRESNSVRSVVGPASLLTELNTHAQMKSPSTPRLRLLSMVRNTMPDKIEAT